MRIAEIKTAYVRTMPKKMEEGILYISKEYSLAIHLCACGCKEKTVTPINKTGEWTLIENNGLVSMTPSIGNFKGQIPYHAHYFITNNKIIWS